jgi:signal transduction histidine kinase
VTASGVAGSVVAGGADSAVSAVADAERRVAEYAGLLAQATDDVRRQLDEIRLPLHILLDNRFGELNENQEEMLGAARTAAERADACLRRLRTIVDIDRGAIALRRDAIPAADLITSLLPGLNADCTAAGVEVTTDIAPALPRILGDRARLQEAGGLLLAERVRALPAGSHVTISAAGIGDSVRIIVTHGGPAGSGADEALARRLIAANGGTVTEEGGRTTITLPTARSGG